MAINFAYLNSSSPGAPTLTGEVGSLIAVLDFVLDVADTTNGWEKVYSGTNKAVYRPRFGNRFYYRCLDDGSLATTAAREAVIRGFESMSDVDTGVDPFPTVSQRANPVIRKSNTANSTARAWWAIRTTRYMMLRIQDNASSNVTEGSTTVMGDVPSRWPGDTWNSVLCVNNTNSSSTAFGPLNHQWFNSYSVPNVSGGGSFIVRSASGGDKSRPTGWTSGMASSSTYIISYATGMAVSGVLDYAPIYLVDSLTTVSNNQPGSPRVRIPNFFMTPYIHSGSGLAVGDTLQDGGREFIVVGQENVTFANNSGHFMLLQTNDTDGAL